MATNIPVQNIRSKIIELRGVQVMLDSDLAELYDVETRVLNQAVKRNIERFPEDFMFQLNEEEFVYWKSQIVISKFEKKEDINRFKMGLRKPPYAFTEQGVAMLSGILKSKKAVEVNVKIMRAFVEMRRFLSQNFEVFEKFQKIEFSKSHDRFLITDKEIYHFGASLKDLGKKWFAFSKLHLELGVILTRLR